MVLSKEDRDAVSFLRMAVSNLRKIADQSPEVATELLRIADQLEVQAADIERRGSGARTH